MVRHPSAEAPTTRAGLFPYLRELESLVGKPGSLPLLNGPGRVPGLAILLSSVSGLVFPLGRRSCGPHLQAGWRVGRGSVYSKGLGTCGRKSPRGLWCWEMEQQQAVRPGAPRPAAPTGAGGAGAEKAPRGTVVVPSLTEAAEAWCEPSCGSRGSQATNPTRHGNTGLGGLALGISGNLHRNLPPRWPSLGGPVMSQAGWWVGEQRSKGPPCSANLQLGCPLGKGSLRPHSGPSRSASGHLHLLRTRLQHDFLVVRVYQRTSYRRQRWLVLLAAPKAAQPQEAPSLSTLPVQGRFSEPGP